MLPKPKDRDESNENNRLIRAISISGEVCSGKSSLVQALFQELPEWTCINVGQKFREFCKTQGISIQEVSFISIDVHKAFDNKQKNLLQFESKIIVEGSLSGWHARGQRDVFKIYCVAPLAVRVNRYMLRENTSKREAKTQIQFRDEHDMHFFQNIYGIIDYRSDEFYDLNVDTSFNTPQEIAQLIVKKII